MDRQLIIDKARKLESRKDLLDLLNEIKAGLTGNRCYPFTNRQLATLCDPKRNTGRYRTFEIPKKSGGSRRICAPRGTLRWIQTCLNELFKAIYTPSPYAMGFTAGKSIVDNARMHTNQNYVFNIDLKDFFPSIDKARVRKRLQLPPFNFKEEIAFNIAGLCSMMSHRVADDGTLNRCCVLPQGAPTSPLLTNAICDTLDRRLHGLAKRFGLHYSRYADDITFSSMQNVYKPGSDFRKELERIITDQHFTINEKKTRLCHCSGRQEVTGLTVGSKINVPRKYVKDIRAILHIWEKYGPDAAYATFYPRYMSGKCQLNRTGQPDLINIISGKLCYLKMVKGDHDPVYMKLHSQFLRLTGATDEHGVTSRIEYLLTMPRAEFETKMGVTVEFSERASDKRVYGHFLFHDRFFVVALSKNLNVENLPENVQISLTRMSAPVDTDGQPFGATSRIVYLLHKPLRGYNKHCSTGVDTGGVSDKLREFVLNLAESCPELQLEDDMKILETNNNENLLSRLIETDFDLSILP